MDGHMPHRTALLLSCDDSNRTLKDAKDMTPLVDRCEVMLIFVSQIQLTDPNALKMTEIVIAVS